MGYPCSMFIFSIPDATTPEMFPVHLFYPRSHHTSNVPCPSFSLPVPTSAWMQPKRNSHGSASLARADRKKTLGISSGSLGEKYSWISPLKFALLPLNPHWKSGEVFSKRDEFSRIRDTPVSSPSLHAKCGKNSSLHGKHRSVLEGEIFLDFFPKIRSAPYLPTLENQGRFSKQDEPPQVTDSNPSLHGMHEVLPILGAKYSRISPAELFPRNPH